MADPMATRWEIMVREIIANLCGKYEAEVKAELVLQSGLMRIEATCGSDMIPVEQHQAGCHSLDCEGCSQECIDRASKEAM